MLGGAPGHAGGELAQHRVSVRDVGRKPRRADRESLALPLPPFGTVFGVSFGYCLKCEMLLEGRHVWVSTAHRSSAAGTFFVLIPSKVHSIQHPFEAKKAGDEKKKKKRNSAFTSI